MLTRVAVGDYSIFVQSWTEPAGGIRGYLTRFLGSGDATFQHIAIWTLLQLLESGDRRLVGLIAQAENLRGMVQDIAAKPTAGAGGGGGGGSGKAGEGSDGDDRGGDDDGAGPPGGAARGEGEAGEDGEGEVAALARRSLQLLDGEKQTLLEG